MKRNTHDLDNWIPGLDSWLYDHETFKKNIKPNILLEGINPDLKKLFEKLDKII